MEFMRKKLKNGIMVVMEKRELPVVAASITNRFGAAYENSEIKGIAHLIEHLVFTGTKTRSHEGISREIEKRGGILNAFTTNEVTSFWFKLPSEHVFIGFGILCDLLKNPTFLAEKFEKEKNIVLEEIKMYHDDPERCVHNKIVENLYGKPFGEGIIGSAKTVNSFKRDFVLDFFKKMYDPSNFIVSVVGNADFYKICEYFEKGFAGQGSKIEEIAIKKLNTEAREGRAGIDQAHFIFAVHAPLFGTKEHYALEVLDAYLANGMSSKLFLKIREDRGLAYTVQGTINAEKNYSYYSIYTGTTKEAIPEIKKIILEEIKEIGKISEDEIAESKERLIGLHKISKEESVRVMSELIFAELVCGAEEYYKREERINAVTLAEVKKLAAEMIKKYSIAAIVPK